MNPQNPAPIAYKPSKTPQKLAIIFGILFVLALAFGLWAFSSRGTVKKNADAKLATANAELAQAQSDEAAATAANKTPYKTFTGPDTFGNVNFQYPKSWSAYIDQSDSSQVEGYFNPNAVPSTQGSTAFALRVELKSIDYSAVVAQYQSIIQAGSLKASAYIPPKMKKVSGASVGLRLDGVVSTAPDGTSQTGSMVILKVRDKTLQIYTESNDYLSDFNGVIASLSYKP